MDNIAPVESALDVIEPIKDDVIGALFSHDVLYKKVPGVLQITSTHVAFIPNSNESSSTNTSGVIKIPWKDILKDQYAPGEQTPMMRLTLHSTTSAMIFKFADAPNTVPGSGATDKRAECDKLRVIMKEQMKLHNMSIESNNVDKNDGSGASNTRTSADIRALDDKLNKLKLRVLEENMVLKRQYANYVLDTTNSILTDADTTPSYGYSSLDSYVTASNDSELKLYWYSLVKNSSSNSKPILSKGKLTALLSDKCFSVNPITNELKITLNPEIIERIFLMCK